MSFVYRDPHQRSQLNQLFVPIDKIYFIWCVILNVHVYLIFTMPVTTLTMLVQLILARVALYFTESKS